MEFSGISMYWSSVGVYIGHFTDGKAFVLRSLFVDTLGQSDADFVLGTIRWACWND